MIRLYYVKVFASLKSSLFSHHADFLSSILRVCTSWSLATDKKAGLWSRLSAATDNFVDKQKFTSCSSFLLLGFEFGQRLSSFNKRNITYLTILPFQCAYIGLSSPHNLKRVQPVEFKIKKIKADNGLSSADYMQLSCDSFSTTNKQIYVYLTAKMLPHMLHRMFHHLRYHHHYHLLLMELNCHLLDPHTCIQMNSAPLSLAELIVSHNYHYFAKCSWIHSDSSCSS